MSVTSKPSPGDGHRAPGEAPELTAYRVLTRLASPAARLILAYRQRQGKEDPNRLGERLGYASLSRPDGVVIWIHAASVGEANSVLPLIERLSQRRSDATLLLTTGTVSSAKLLETRLPANTLHQFIPLDAPKLVARFLDHWRPQLAILTEQEIWPNLVIEASARAIPLAIVNARMSARSCQRWQKRQRLATALFDRFTIVLAQSDEITDRFRSIGATNTRSVGNLKIDAPPPPVDQPALDAFVAALGGRPHLLAASTHEGEETIIAAAHRCIAQRVDGLLTVIAPRHPQRGNAIAAALTTAGFRVRQRSAGELPAADTEIYLADTLGELGTFYAAADIAFVGGSLIPHGGQNPIEAVRLGAVVLTGPSHANFTETYRTLLDAGGAFEVDSAEAICSRVVELIVAPEQCELAGRNADTALRALSGALERTVAEIMVLLPAVAETAGAR